MVSRQLISTVDTNPDKDFCSAKFLNTNTKAVGLT